MARLGSYLRREWLSLILAGAVVALALNCLFGPRGLRDLMVLRQHRGRLESRRARLRAENAGLETNVQMLRSDDRYLERLIRRELGYARPGELIYKFSADNPSPTP